MSEQSQEIPMQEFTHEELKYPIAIFGIDEHWISELQEVLVKLSQNPEKMIKIAQYESLTGYDSSEEHDTRRIETTSILEPYLQNLRIISKPFQTYLEVIAMDRIKNQIRAILYNEDKIAKGWITIQLLEQE